MIRFLFEETDPMRKEETSPAPHFRFDHEIIRQGPDNQAVAHLLPNGLWETTDKCHLRGNCMGKAQICFEDDSGDASKCFGPYDDIWIAGGAIFADDRPIALFQEDSYRWTCFRGYTDWPAVVVKTA